VAPWLDPARNTEPMLEPGMTATEWARYGTSQVLWLAVPLVIGWWRVLRGDVQ
jgi:ABC-2 type transport system permease protein